MADPTVTVLASGAGNTASATTVTFTAQPAGTILMLAFAGNSYRNGTPSGWTAIQTVGDPNWMGCSALYKKADGSETTVTYTLQASTVSSGYVLLAITNIDPTTPLDVSAVNFSATGLGNNASHVMPSITPTAGRRIVFECAFRTGESSTTGGSFTNSYTVAGTGSGGAATEWEGAVVAYNILDGDGSTAQTSTASFTMSGNTTAQQTAGIAVSFKVASGLPTSVPLTTPTVTVSAQVSPTTVGGTNGSITVTWPAVANADHYEAAIATGLNQTTGFTTKSSAATSPYVFTSLGAGNYTVAIRAIPAA